MFLLIYIRDFTLHIGMGMEMGVGWEGDKI